MSKSKSRRRAELKQNEQAEAGFTAALAGSSRLPITDTDPISAHQSWATVEKMDSFIKGRDLLEGNPFVGDWHRVRSTFFNDQFRLVGDKLALDDLTKRNATDMIERLNRDIWQEFLLQDNVVVFWLTPLKKADLPQPMVMDCEVCQYTDWPSEVLKIKLTKRTLTTEEKAKMNDRWVKAYEKGDTVTINPEEGENFAVLTRGKKGKGFCQPRLRQAYKLLGTLDNLHRADFNGSFQSRTVIQHISVGREMKFQDALSQPTYFTITKAEKKQIENELREKAGAFRAVTDIKVAFDWLFMDPKFFDAAKFEGTLKQLDRWGGAGMMLLSTGEEWLLPFFAAEGRSDRGLVAGLMNRLLADPTFILGQKKDKPVTVGWNPNTFRDFKTVLEMLRFAVGQGVMSNTTAREFLDLDVEKEGNRLEEEKAKPDRYRPTFEAKQGLLSEDKGGRPEVKPSA